MTVAKIVFASMTGNTEEIADIVADKFRDLGVEVEVDECTTVDAEDFLEADIAIVATYTYGDGELPDEIVQVNDAEAFEMTRRLAAEEGLLVGGSSGMAVMAALKYAREHDLDENQLVVALLPDSGRSYMEKIFNDDWMRANGFADVVERTSKPSLAERYL